jgi:hypothetical protein
MQGESDRVDHALMHQTQPLQRLRSLRSDCRYSHNEQLHTTHRVCSSHCDPAGLPHQLVSMQELSAFANYTLMHQTKPSQHFRLLRTNCHCSLQRAGTRTKNSSQHGPASLPTSGNPRAVCLYRLHSQTPSEIPTMLLSAGYSEVAAMTSIDEPSSKRVELRHSARNPESLPNCGNTGGV